MTTEVQLRCPNDPRKLLAKVLSSGEKPKYIQPQNWVELACRTCRDNMRREGQQVHLVCHRFNIAGELMDTVVT